MFLKKKRVKRDLKAEALKDAERRISEFKSNLPDLDPEKAQKKFSHIAIKAFSRIYGLHYEATYEEVASDIQRKRIPDETKEKVKGFCQKMVNLEYGKHQQKGKKLSDLVDEFEEILKHDHLEEHEEKKNWFKAPKKAALPDPPAPDMPPPPETPVSTTTNKLFGKKLALPHMELPRVEMPHLGMHEAISSIFSKKPKELEILPSFEEAASSLPDLPLMEIAEPEKAAAEGLPEFDIKEKDKLDKDIERLLATIDTDKKKIAEEVGKLKAEGDLIDEQRKKIKAMAEETPKEDARQARIRELQKDIESKKEELKAKEADLQAREKELNSKIIEIESLRGEIDGLNAKVSNDSEKLRLREQELKQKEKVLDEIRLEVEQQNVKVMKEVDKFKLELKEKQENFLELQKFFNQRENKLSHEESHFLEQKRRHVKYLEISIVKHRELLEKDLLVTERRLLETINEYERIIKEADAYQGKFRELEKDKLFLEKELHTKMEFFDKAEKEMLSKDPQLTEMALAITAKEEKLKEREDMILRLEQEVKLARSMQRKNK